MAPKIESVQEHGIPRTCNAEEVLSPRQVEVLRSILDAVVRRPTDQELKDILAAAPAEADEVQRKAIEEYARKGFSDYPGSVDAVVDQMAQSFSAANQFQFKVSLTLLGTRAGCFAFTGKLGPIDKLTLQEREQALRRWASSPISDLRKLAKTFTALPLWSLYLNHEEACNATGYPYRGDPAKQQDAARVRPAYPYKFEEIAAEGQQIETGVLIIGSGSGGGVVAHTLANAGEEILIVEKGQYLPTDKVTGAAREGFHGMYERKGVMLAEEGGVSVLLASTWGGGSAINWSASLRPPKHMREQWDKQYGLKHWNSAEYDRDVEYVCDRMGVSSKNFKHSFGNTRIMAGAQRLGIHSAEIPQNTGGTQHSCGFCGHGCPFGEKHGTLVTWLRDAAERGARFMQRTRVERILFGADHTTPIDLRDPRAHYPSAKNNVAIGAILHGPDGKTAVVKARKGVFVCAGSINTPPTLLRSGLKNPNIGKNLHLHPCVFLSATYKEDVRPWEGSIMTALSDGSEDRDGTHFGSKLEVVAPSASVYSALSIWPGSVEHKRRMVNYRHTCSYIILARDRDSGTVTMDAEGGPVINYVPSAYDRQSLTAGLVNGARILLAGGATSIATSQPFIDAYVPAPGHKGDEDPAFVAWLSKVADTGVLAMGAAMGSAHQMGTCRMGSAPSNSVCDARGRVWGTKGLWIADASTFPTASGVNPMVTTMSTARSISRFALDELQGSDLIQAHL